MAEKLDTTDLTPAEWLKRIERAKKYREQIKDKQGWQTNIEAYEGDYKINNTLIKAPPINIVFGYIDTLIARLYARDPYICVNAKKDTTIQRAHLLEKVVNYEKKSLNIKGEVEKVIRDALLASMGWIKFGFAGEIEVSTPEKDSPAENVSEFIKNGEVYACHVYWEDVLFDPTLSKDPPYDCRWIAHRIVKPIKAFKDSKLYDWPEDIKPNVTTIEPSGKKVDETLKDSDTDMLEVWEIHDKDTNKIYAVAAGCDSFGRSDDNQLEMNGFPFSCLKFNPVPNKPYPIADISIILPQILERIKLRGAQLQHIKRWSRQLSVEKGAMSAEEMDKFTQGADGAITQREKGFAPPVPIQYAPMQDEIFVLDDLIQKDMDMVIGQNDVDRGGPARTKTRTKYELQESQAGTSTRGSKKQDKLEDFLGEVFSKIIALMKQFYTTERYAAISGLSASMVTEELGLGPENVVKGGIKFTKEDIQGEYDIEVKAGSTLPLNKDVRIRTIQGLLEMMPQTGMNPGNPLQIALISELLRDLDMQEAIKAWDLMRNQMSGPQGAPPPSQVPPAPGAGTPVPVPPPGQGQI